MPQIQQHAKRVSIHMKVAKMVEYVNGKKGWTIVGWYRAGGIMDPASEGKEKIMNYIITVHISLLILTDQSIVSGQDDKFNKLQISRKEEEKNDDSGQEENSSGNG